MEWNLKYTLLVQGEHESGYLSIYESIDPEPSVLSCLALPISEKGRKERRGSFRVGGSVVRRRYCGEDDGR